MSDPVKDYLAKIGREGGKKGGKASGKSKVRGDADYYRRIAAKKHKKTTPDPTDAAP